MSAQKGKDLLLKLDDGTGTLVTVAGLRARRITFNAETVDATNADSVGRWRELLAGAGVLKASITGAGIFKNAQSDALVRGNFFNGVIGQWQVVVPSFGHIDGVFQITSLDYRGDHVTELTFDITLESAGALTFTAGA
jgi:TP901-1 family phage major tail protein